MRDTMLDRGIELKKVTKENISSLNVVMVATLPVNYSPSFYKAIIKGRHMSYLAEVHGKAVGCVVWREEEGQTHLLTLGVFILYRRRGIGSALLNLCIKECKSKEVFLYVHAENDAAIQFYKDMGFGIVSRVPDYYRNMHDNTALKMIRHITS